MKRYGLLLVILVMFLASLAIPAQAGKPQPTSYPPPGFEIQAYPPPNATPVPVQPAPGFPEEFCAVAGKPCVWGWFGVAGYPPSWWVSIDGIGIQPDITDGVICITPFVGTEDYCDQLRFARYDYTRDRNWYRSYNPPHCGRWYVFMGYLNGTPAELRQPNDYLVKCSYLPFQKRG